MQFRFGLLGPLSVIANHRAFVLVRTRVRRRSLRTSRETPCLPQVDGWGFAYCSIYGTGLPDLLATSGDAANGYYLDYYYAFAPCGFNQAFAIKTPTPDGTADWNRWTLATLSDGSGMGMFLWNQSTGALYLWRGVTAHDNGDGTGTLSYTQYRISPHWQRGKSLSTLEAADLNGDGVPDLWAVTPDGIARAYLISNLSATGPAKIEPQKPQKLS